MERGQADQGAVLDRLQRAGTSTPAELLAFFDSLPPAPLALMLGDWRGSEVRTGHPLEGLLSLYGWWGKRFERPDSAHPLVFSRGRDSFCVNLPGAPLTLLRRAAWVLRAKPVAALGRGILPLLTTNKPGGRLGMREYRGVVSGALCYDTLPIVDHFRLVDDDTLLGLMDARGVPGEYFFVLRRVSTVGPS